MPDTFPGPPENPTWWDHPEADPLADMQAFAERVRSADTVYQPYVIPPGLLRLLNQRARPEELKRLAGDPSHVLPPEEETWGS